MSVGDRPELEAFHSRKIVLERQRGGARFVTDINLILAAGRRRLLGRWLRARPAPQKKPHSSGSGGPRKEDRMNKVRSIFIGALLLTWDHCGAHYVEPIDRLK